MSESMMAANSSKFPAWFIIFVLFLHVFVASSSVEGNNVTHQCVDGTYEHDGRTCCLCGAGMHLENEQHCTTNLQYGTCKACDPDTYNSHPNYQKSCEPCTSCSHPIANQEVDQRCTPARDAKCRCKKGHYCNSGAATCITCHPCKECAEGIKIACTATNNTICNDETEGANVGGIIAGVVIVLLAIVFCIIGFIWRRRRLRSGQNIQLQNVNATDVEKQPLTVPVVELQPYLHGIAEVIGWTVMKEVALHSKIPNPRIESCQLDHPNNSQEQTVQLLTIWQEQQGREASQRLVQILDTCGKRATAEKVRDILTRPHPSA